MHGQRVAILSVFTIAMIAATSATLVPLAGRAAKTTPGEEEAASGGGLGISFQPGPQGPGILSVINCAMATFDSHDYRVCNIGHPAETALAAGMDGKVWALNSVRPQFSTDGGASWSTVTLPQPGNIGGVIYPEGDIIVAPNGDILTNWLTINNPHTAVLYVSTNGGTTWSLKPLSGVHGFPDRPWIVTSSETPADPSNPLQPNPYLALAQAGTGVKLVYGSGDRGTTWYKVPTGTTPPLQAFSSPANAYLDYSKPFAQGMPSIYLVLGNGQVMDVVSHRMTYDFIHWTTANVAGWPSAGTYPYWDTGADGTIYAVGFTLTGGVWKVHYKWYDGTWHDGAAQPTLTAQADYPNGLGTGSAPARHDPLMAIKSHGNILGINTRQGLQDVLIRITDPTDAGATWTKDVIGPGGATNDRYDYPQLVFDIDGRAIMSYMGSRVAYATAV